MVTRLDVQDRDSIASVVSDGVERFGRIDALINNAGFSPFGVFEAISREKIQAQFDVNLFGLMDVTRAPLPHVRQNKSGLIINIGSRVGLVGLPMTSLYCAAKYALEGFSEALAYELSSQNIVIKIVEPSGGLASTSFSERMAQEKTFDTTPADYAEFLDRISAIFATMQATRKTTADDVARVIYEAATGGSGRFRYFIGEDVGDFVQAKREKSDQDYIHFMRARFSP